ncbi:hypothetical protein CRE_10308 [Caenorhabditis remanei]|uniref:SCP domain-containing protein n=1 Tax=Caenorhabditis remanei TaxID=31234 RepID=E3M6E8_CAERE|nr:hypothetical protein CRE_10308 [Caenorhabditis remanei]
MGTYVAQGITKPAGSNILKMKWDATLETSAQAYANTCQSVHSNTPGVGESLYTRYTTLPISGLDVYGGAASVAWEQEFQRFGWSSNTFTHANTSPIETTTAHATQMAWASTGSIGCGVKNCGVDPSIPGYNRAIVVCHYKSSGNILNQQIYKTGVTCSQCPTGTTCEPATGLCA